MTSAGNRDEDRVGAAAASRRLVLGAGVAAPLLAACGSGGSSSDSSSAPSGGPAGVVATKADIPVGSGKIFTADKVVITQPAAGEFKAFSAVCTHQGCVVAKITGEEIDCPCHGSKYSIKDGSVLGGPAPKPLPELTVTVEGEDLSVS